ncbi:MAG: dienelactone hydrolase family protein [Planctomycetia bacterium]|nr:dienelactone hydrolase family protein [Planctomycetia bacterium]
MCRSTWRKRDIGSALVAIILAGVLPLAAEAAPAGHVAKTYNNAPFDYTMTPLSESDAYRVVRLTYPSPVVTPVEANNTIPADYYLPKGIKPGDAKRPAVICLHILNGNFELENMICSALASRGVPAVMFKLPYYGERSLPGGRRALLNNAELFLGSLPQGVEDTRRTVDLLASRPEVDPERIGVVGISMGAMLATGSASIDKRLARVALILGGGDLPYVIDHSPEAHELKEFIAALPADKKAAFERKIAEIDPLAHAPGLRDRAVQGKVLMFNGTDDDVIPKPCAEKLAAALGMSDRVVWLEGLGHYTAMAALPQIMQTTVDFFAEDLPPGVKPAAPPAAGASPVQVVSTILAQLNALLSIEPKPGKCHYADLEVAATLKGGQKIDAALRYVRGAGDRFSLRLNLKEPLGVNVSLGYGTDPWLASGTKVVFKGGAEPADKATAPARPFAGVDPKNLVKLRVVAGALAGASLAPSLLDSVATFAEEKTDEGRAVRITFKGKLHGSALLTLKLDGKTPRRLTFDVDGTKGAVTFVGWQTDTVAPDALFAPPPDAPVTEVDRADVYRIFSSLFNFLMEMVQ